MLREILDRTAARVGNDITNQPAVETELRSLIGRLYLELGAYPEAEQMYRAALNINQQFFGRQSVQAAASLNGLGLALFKDGKLPEAETVMGDALASRRRLLGNRNADVASSLNNLATVYRYQHRFPEAEKLIREALEIRRSNFGDESAEVADSLHNLSYILIDEGKRTEGEATANQLLAIRQRLSGKEHPLTASALSDVAWAEAWNGKLDEAISSNQQALVMRRNLLGDEHPEVAKTLAEIGELMAQQGKLGEAHAVLNAAISIQRRILGENNPDTLDSLDFQGWILEVEGKWTEAEDVHQHAMTIWRQRAGNEYPQALSELAGLVRALVAQKKFEQAKQLLDETLTPGLVKKPASADILAQRVDLLGRQGRWNEAAADANRVLEFQPDHYRVHTLAGLLAITTNRPAYGQLCGRILSTFANTTNAYIAERMASDCLLLADSGVDLSSVDKLVNTAVTLGGGDDLLPYIQVCRAMMAYRKGHFAEAVEWAEKPKSQVYAQAKACAVLAMAHWRLGHKDAARDVLLKGDAVAPSISSETETTDLGGMWLAWVFARVSLDEATALIRPASITGNTGKEP
jgi:tetratricopeptide (TPR) repeat protein